MQLEWLRNISEKPVTQSLVSSGYSWCGGTKNIIACQGISVVTNASKLNLLCGRVVDRPIGVHRLII